MSVPKLNRATPTRVARRPPRRGGPCRGHRQAPRGLAALALGATIALGVALGCDPDRGQRCEQRADCPAGQRCGEESRCEPAVPAPAGQPCEARSDCLPGLLCAADRICRAREVDWCRPDEDCAERGDCPNQGCWHVPDAERDCEQGASCELYGRCHAERGRCIARADADCRHSLLCRDAGRCRARDGRCVAASAADCAPSSGCRTDGRCQAAQGECVAASDEGCAKSPACKQQGRCHWVDGACRVKTDQDCRQSELCPQCGLCRAAGERCVARSNADCRSSHQCWNFGQCVLAEDRCVARADADCAASWECKIWGHCVAENEVCVVDDEGCRRSRRCATDGECTARGDSCEAGPDRDGPAVDGAHPDAGCGDDDGTLCAAQAASRPAPADAGDGGDADSTARERSHDGGPAAPTDEELAALERRCLHSSCLEEGRCTWRAGQCVAATDRDCRQGRSCQRDGKCVARGGRCVAGLPSPAQCRAATECAVLGRCGARGPYCVVEGDEDCRGSALCREGGRCRALHPGTPFGRCVAAKAPDAGAPLIGDGTVPPFGRRMLRCEEPLPSPVGGPRLRPADDVHAELRGRHVWIEPLGVRMGVPSHWQPRTISEPWVAVDPQEFARVAPRLRLYASDPVFPVSALLLESHLPLEALVALLAPESYGGDSNAGMPVERGFWGTLVLVFALQDPATAVRAALEPALCSHAHAISCPRDREARYSPYRRSATREWLDWDFAEPWYRWRDVQGPWLRIGAEASWHAHGHHRGNAVDLFIRRFGAATLVVVVSTTEHPEIPVEPEALLPVAAPRDAGAEAPRPAPDVRCILPPKGNIHWALRPTAP